MTDLVEIFRARISELGLTHRETDELARLPDGYTGKILCGMKRPGARTIERLCGALAVTLVPVVDAEHEKLLNLRRQR